uniref:Pentatricopeptide repeat-containing protein n=1 Tax=Kalanchoe fedtschenkoi TaxID=63787 RepID=A0A7N0TLF7_KALFE
MLSPALPSVYLSLVHNPALLTPQLHIAPLSKTANKKRLGFCRLSGKEAALSGNRVGSDNFEHPDEGCCGGESVSGLSDGEELVRGLQSSSRLREVRKLHSAILKVFGYSNVYVVNNLVSAYLKYGKLVDARKLFDEMPEPNVVTWTALINGCLGLGYETEAFQLFGDFLETGIRPNAKTYVCALNLCGRRADLALGRQIHARVVKGSWRSLIVNSAVVNFYAQSGELSCAFSSFDEMVEKDVICWTTIISACARQGRGEEAFDMFSQMLAGGFSPNEFTVCSVLKACGEERALRLGRQLHGALVKKIYQDDVFVGTSLVGMYSKCGQIEDSRRAFNAMRKRNTVTWTSIIAGYARKGFGHEAISLFRVMKRRNIFGNDLTIVSTLRACGSVEALLTGKEVHAQIVKNSLQRNTYIGSTLVWFYCKCGEYETGFTVLQQMPERDAVSWTAMISGCANLGHEPEALEFLKEMLGEGVEPNPFTYSSALKACANLEAIHQGKLIHSSLNKTPAVSNVFVGSALINMYAKCGYMTEALRVFDSMPERNLVSWKAMIVACARSGLCREALQLLYRMQKEGIGVDEYIVTAVLSACGDIEWEENPVESCVQSS